MWMWHMVSNKFQNPSLKDLTLWPGVESVIAEELAKTDAKVTVRVIEWSPDPNPLTLSPTAQTLETKVPAVDDGPFKLPSSLTGP